MKCIFLDIDGVFNTTADNNKIHTKFNNIRIVFDVDLLNYFLDIFKFCKENKIMIYITSSIAINTTIYDWEWYFKETFRLNVNGIILGVDYKQNLDRGLAIQNVLDYYKEEIKDYLIIDDSISDIKDYHDEYKIIEIDNRYGITILDMEYLYLITID